MTMEIAKKKNLSAVVTIPTDAFLLPMEDAMKVMEILTDSKPLKTTYSGSGFAVVHRVEARNRISLELVTVADVTEMEMSDDER